MSWPISTERISYCHTAKPRGSPRSRNTNESRVAGIAATSNWRCCAGGDWAAAATLTSREQSQRIGLEDGLLLRGVEREREKLVDVQLHVLHPRTRPVGAPQHAVGDLGEARKVLQQPGGGNPGHVEPDLRVPSKNEECLLHVQRASPMGHHELQVREVDRDVVQLHRIAVLGSRAGKYARPRVHRSEEHTSELQSPCNLVCRLLLEKKK